METKAVCPEKLAGVKALVLDVDGVLTRGDIIYNGGGDEIKVFSARDGLGLRMLALAGAPVAVLTGRRSAALLHRMANLGITRIWDGAREKTPALMEISEALGVAPRDMAYMGDDLPDLGVMGLVGFPVAVADAHPLVAEAAVCVTLAKGGEGAVREVCEALVRAKGCWDEVLRKVAA
jgi:3-deoxy-D-manno-octulosonate 8-phosphate phosphatase (KDO 8-P phosphatase)